MFNLVKELKNLLNIKRKYFILHVLAGHGYGMLIYQYEDFIDKTLEFKTDEQIINDIKEMIQESRELAARLNA